MGDSSAALRTVARTSRLVAPFNSWKKNSVKKQADKISKQEKKNRLAIVCAISNTRMQYKLSTKTTMKMITITIKIEIKSQNQVAPRATEFFSSITISSYMHEVEEILQNHLGNVS